MQCCKNEVYLSPLLLAIGLFVHKVSRSRLLVDVFHSFEFSVSQSEVLQFEKCDAVSSVKFDDFVSDIELEPENRFWQFIADNFDHNEDTTTGLGPAPLTSWIQFRVKLPNQNLQGKIFLQ